MGGLQAEAGIRTLNVRPMQNRTGHIQTVRTRAASPFGSVLREAELLESGHMLYYMHMTTRGQKKLRFEDAMGTGRRDSEVCDPGFEFTAVAFQGFTSKVLDLSICVIQLL